MGDFATAVVSTYIIYEAWRLGLARGVLARMIFNVALDWLVGSLPILGDVFDVAYKANLRNLRLMGIAP